MDWNLKYQEHNMLKAEIKELLERCEKYDIDNEMTGGSFFAEPITEEKMLKWEAETGIEVPKTYKEWLRFTEKSRIAQNTAMFWGTDEFHSKYVPEDLIVIGEMVGDGEVVCFSKETGEFVSFFEGRIGKRYSDFRGVLNEVLRMLGKGTTCKSGLSEETMKLFMKFHQKSMDRKNNEG